MLTFSDSAILVAVFFSTGAALGGSKKGHFANHPQYGAGASGSPGCVSISPVAHEWAFQLPHKKRTMYWL